MESKLSAGRWPVAVLAVLLGLTTGGCGIIGAPYALFIAPLLPKPTIAAEHDMSEKVVLVWVEDVSGGQQKNVRLRRELTQQIGEELLKHKAAREVIDYNRIARFRNRHPDFRKLLPEQLGSRFDADEVLYILIKEFRLGHEAGQGFYRGNLFGQCKVVEVATGKRLWPEGRTSQVVSASDKLTHGEGQAFEDRLLRRLVAKIPGTLVKSFYEHKVDAAN